MSTAAHRLVLVGPPRHSASTSGRGAAAVRRYRIARVRVEGTRPPGASPHEHLKRIYD